MIPTLIIIFKKISSTRNCTTYFQINAQSISLYNKSHKPAYTIQIFYLSQTGRKSSLALLIRYSNVSSHHLVLISSVKSYPQRQRATLRRLDYSHALETTHSNYERLESQVLTLCQGWNHLDQES